METKYPISIFWSDDDEGFIALVPGFPGLSAFGKTREKAAKEIQIALKLMLESLAEDGITPPIPSVLPEHSGQLRIRMPKTLHAELAAMAERQGVSLNTYIISALAKDMGGRGVLEEFKEQQSSLENMLARLCLDMNTMQRNIGSANASMRIEEASAEWKTTEEQISQGTPPKVGFSYGH